MIQPKHSGAAGLDNLTRTFSRDQHFCDVAAQVAAAELARVLIYVSWAHRYSPAIQQDFEAMALKQFPSATRSDASLWTVSLLGATARDIGLIGYAVSRGLLWESGHAARRALEHVGVITTLWKEPHTAQWLTEPEDIEFRKAFVWESDSTMRAQLRGRGVQKRFANCIMDAGATQLYSLLSKYSVHGGSLGTLASAQIVPNNYSCMFVNRPDPTAGRLKAELEYIGNVCELLAIEIVGVLGHARRTHALPPSEAGEAGHFITELIDKDSGLLGSLVRDTIRDLRWHGESST